MVDAEPAAGFGKVRSPALGDELTRVHPDYHERVVKPLLELPDPREQVKAVDSAVRPEVEDDDLAAQVGDAERALDVEPVEPLREFRRAHGGQGNGRHGRHAHRCPADAVTASLKGRRAMLVRQLGIGGEVSSVRRVASLGDQVELSSPHSMFNVAIRFSSLLPASFVTTPASEIPAVTPGINGPVSERATPNLGKCRASATARELKPSLIR
jgi:hypothetical protein